MFEEEIGGEMIKRIHRVVADGEWFVKYHNIDLRVLEKVMLNCRLDGYITDMARNLLVEFMLELPALFDREIVVQEAWPENWWEAFKERWFPGWLLRRYPVKMKSINIRERVFKAICPHMPCDGRSRHVEFLFYESQRK